MLKIDDIDKEYIVCTYASYEGLGGLLMQDEHLVFYESQKLKEHEKNYPTLDIELATVVHAFKMWKHYLMGSKFILKIDYHILRYLFEKPNLNFI